MANKNLNAAKTAKKDEFYTQLTDIERELQHYWQHFRDKVVLCNCDDPYESNFFKYFALRFNQLGLKKLICTCYNGSPVQGNELMIDFGDFTNEPKKIAYKVEITEVKDLNGDGAVDLSDVQYLLKNDKNVISTLKTGDFRDPECIELLKQADVVVTNPPFSLFRDYIGQLMEYKKKFLIIGNQNAITYKEIYPLILNNELWMGYHSGHTWFAVPDDYEIPDFYDLNDTKRLRSNGYAYRDGRLWRNLGNICWFTNLDHQKRHEEIDLICRYSHEEYPHYENFDAIEVSKATNIPYDYEGKMGVPVTFLEKYNPEQFEIIGISLVLGTTKPKDLPKSKQGGPAFYIKRNGEYQRLFARIVIRNKHPQTI